MKTKKTTLVRYGELALKSKSVRRRFEKRLVNNIKSALGRQAKVRPTYGRITAEYDVNAEKLKQVFGVVSFSYCMVTDAKIENILKLGLSAAKNTIKKGHTFAVKTNRVGKHSFTSEQINKELGALIVKELGNKVKLSSPDKTIYIDIRDKSAYMHTNIIKGPGGLPVGVAGKAAVLMENKNSLAAAWLAMKRGCEIVPIFIGKTNTSWLNTLKRWSCGSDIKPHTTKTKDPEAINKIISETSSLGLVTSETLKDSNKYRKTKSEHSVPVYWPLIGFSGAEMDSVLKVI